MNTVGMLCLIDNFDSVVVSFYLVADTSFSSLNISVSSEKLLDPKHCA